MGGEKDDKRTPTSRKRFTVVEFKEPKDRSWKILVLALLAIFCLGLSAVAGYFMYRILNPASKTMQVSQAAKILGIPMTGKNLLGVTFVKGSPEGDTMGFTSKCPNCNYEGVTLTMRYPKEPGPGWRAYDLAPEIKDILTTPTVVAMEAK